MKIKRADVIHQTEHDVKLTSLWDRYKSLEKELLNQKKSWEEIFNDPEYLQAQKAWRAKRNSCPQCGSEKTEVVDYDSTWRDGDVVCVDCGTYVRMYDAG